MHEGYGVGSIFSYSPALSIYLPDGPRYLFIICKIIYCCYYLCRFFHPRTDLQVNQETKKKETKITLRRRDDEEVESSSGSDESEDED